MNQKEREELDEQLKQLALVAQQYPVLAQERQLALSQLINLILQSGILRRPYQGQFSGSYQDIYEEALQDLLLFICQHIEKYNPERGGVSAWCNFLLERRFFKEAIPKILDKQGMQKMSLFELDNLALPEEQPVLTEILRECIESDPENLFKNNCISKQPKANFQVLAIQRLMGLSWKEIAAEFELEISTVSSFYYRSLDKFAGKLKEYCSERVV